MLRKPITTIINDSKYNLEIVVKGIIHHKTKLYWNPFKARCEVKSNEVEIAPRQPFYQNKIKSFPTDEYDAFKVYILFNNYIVRKEIISKNVKFVINDKSLTFEHTFENSIESFFFVFGRLIFLVISILIVFGIILTVKYML